MPRKYKDLVGQKFGKLTLLALCDQKCALFLCDCGKEKEAYINNVLAGRTKSCGCNLAYDLSERRAYNSRVGEKYGRLTIVKFLAGNPRGRNCLVRCDCGQMREKSFSSVLSGTTRSCGCLNTGKKPSRKTHGMSADPIYKVWHGMKMRCHNPNSSSFKNYGARGIEVCDRWRTSFTSFLEEMGRPPIGALIDRIDNSKGYSKENCRWATWKTQSRNKRSNILLTYNSETLCAIDWAKRYNIHHNTFLNRIAKGWDIEEALTTPPGPSRKSTSRGSQRS